MQELSCKHADIFALVGSAAEKCALVTQACAPTQSLINFYSLYYCRVNNPWAMAVILLILIAAVFIFIYEVVDEYVVPAVMCIVKTLRMSDALAGVTLLAFANGAGDVITALVASGTDEAVAYNIGGVLGAGLFVLTVVVFATVELSPTPIVLPRTIISRDLPIYALGTAYVIVCGIKGSITFYDALGIIALYLSIVLMVVVQEGSSSGRPKPSSLELGQREDEEELEVFTGSMGTRQNSLVELTHRKSLKNALRSFSVSMKRRDEIMQKSAPPELGVQAVEAIDFPMRIARKLTIPPCNEELYTRQKLAACPLLGLPFLLWAFGIQLSWTLCVPISLTLSLVLYFFAPERFGAPHPFSLALSVLGILVAVLWTKAASELLIDSLGFIGLMGNMSTTYLGLTVIAVGSALPDAITTVALARTGQAKLGLTGGYAGQIFGLLIGFGASMAKRVFVTGKPVKFELFHFENLQLILVLGTALFVILATIVWNFTHRFRLEKAFTRSLFGIYIAFLAACTAISAREAYKSF